MRASASLIERLAHPLKNLVVRFLLGLYLPHVVDFSQLRSPLFVHLLLDLPPPVSVAFIHLLEHINLVLLPGERVLDLFLLGFSGLAFQLLFQCLLFVAEQPALLLLHLFLQLHSLQPRVVHVLHEVDPSLVFTHPLILTHLPLLLGLKPGQVLDQLLLRALVLRLLQIVLLEVDHFLSPPEPLFLLEPFDLPLPVKRAVEELLVALLLDLKLLVPELLLYFVVLDEL